MRILSLRTALVALAALVLAAQVCQAGPPRLIVRGDDMGYTHAGNEACIRAFKEGIETSIEVIVPSPWFPEAVKMLAENPQIDVGVHLALTSEWDNLKWRPLTTAASLRDEDGYFPANLDRKKDHRWTLEDVEQELRAQIEMAKRKIPRVSHISGHMGCESLSPEVKELVRNLCKEYKLDIFLEDHGVKTVGWGPSKAGVEERIAAFSKTLDGLEEDKVYLLITHPGLDTPELRSIRHHPDDNIAVDRQADTDLMIDRRVRQRIEARGIKLIGYKDLRK